MDCVPTRTNLYFRAILEGSKNVIVDLVISSMVKLYDYVIFNISLKNLLGQTKNYVENYQIFCIQWSESTEGDLVEIVTIEEAD